MCCGLGEDDLNEKARKLAQITDRPFLLLLGATTAACLVLVIIAVLIIRSHKKKQEKARYSSIYNIHQDSKFGVKKTPLDFSQPNSSRSIMEQKIRIGIFIRRDRGIEFPYRSHRT